MGILIIIVCIKHSEIKRECELKEYLEALENKSIKKFWFCEICGRRLKREYGFSYFIFKDKFSTQNLEKKNKAIRNFK